ncbi:MAG: chain-length determining protein, partial [Firmicutes bacterium]|nr:chain-length determining protein [Bacillota bacterium]
MQENEEVIDLAEVKKIVCQYKKRLLGIVVGVTLVALALAFLLPKEYESTALVRAKSQQQGGGFAMQASAALALLGGSTQSPTQGYIAMMKSRSVLDPIIDGLDLPPEKKEKLDNEKFAKKYLEFETTKGTDLIEVTGTGRTPEEAQQIAGGVVDNFRQLLTRLNQSDQSLLRKFLDERIQIAKKELDEAEQSLE